MKRFIRYYLSLVFFLCSLLLYAQSAKIDSLKKVLFTAKEDTNKVNTLIKLAIEFQGTAPDSAIRYGKMAIALSGNIKISDIEPVWNIGIGKSSITIAVAYYRKSDYAKSLDYYFKALSVWEKIEQQTKSNGKSNKVSSYILNLKSKTLGNIGLVYWNQSNYSKALKYYFQALKIDEDLGNKNGIARHLGNIGVVYAEEASAPSNESVKVELTDNALRYFLRALAIFEELGLKKPIATVLGNVGSAYVSKADYAKAMEYYFKALKMRQEIGAKDLIASAYGNIGTVYFKTNKFNDAEMYLQKAIALSDTIGDVDGLKEWHQNYSRLDSARNNFKSALEHYKKYITARDSISNEENTKKQTQTEMQYEFDKKETQAKAEQEKKDAVSMAEKKKQQVILYSVIGGLGVVLLFALFVYRSLLQIRKKNIEITEQKKIIEEKQKEILDSIHYAARIQRCILPTEKYIAQNLARLKAKRKNRK